jgi:hypothetical protein
MHEIAVGGCPRGKTVYPVEKSRNAGRVVRLPSEAVICVGRNISRIIRIVIVQCVFAVGEDDQDLVVAILGFQTAACEGFLA